MQEWTCYNPWYFLGYCHYYGFENWNTCIKRGFSPSPPPHLTMNKYFYHQEQLLNFNRCYHNWFDLLEYGTMCIVHDNACNDNCHSRENPIIHKVRIRRWPYSSFQKDTWLFSFLFQLLFYFLCSSHYSLSLAILLNVFDSYFLLLTTCVRSPPMCKSHYDFPMCCYVWEAFLISSTHHTHCTSIASWFVTNDTFSVYDPLFY
jgi:hypothetical protein